MTRRISKNRQRKNQKELLEVLSTLNKEQLQIIFKYLDRCAIDHVSSLVYNLIYFKNKNLSKESKKKLISALIGNEPIVKYVSRKSNNFEKKKMKLSQRGGFLGTLFAVGLPILAEIVASQVRK